MSPSRLRTAPVDLPGPQSPGRWARSGSWDWPRSHGGPAPGHAGSRASLSWRLASPQSDLRQGEGLLGTQTATDLAHGTQRHCTGLSLVHAGPNPQAAARRAQLSLRRPQRGAHRRTCGLGRPRAPTALYTAGPFWGPDAPEGSPAPGTRAGRPRAGWGGPGVRTAVNF